MTGITEKDLFNATSQQYIQLLEEAKQKIQTTRIQLAKIATQEQFRLYWWFGERIVESQKKYRWGKSVVEQLAKDLRNNFPDTTYGFSTRNLWEMRRFYLEYKKHPILQQLVAEIPWGHNLAIISKVKDLVAREYYLCAVRDQGWTRDVLIMQIDSQAYERHLLAKKQHNFEKALPTSSGTSRSYNEICLYAGYTGAY